jgi:hypothetical protein
MLRKLSLAALVVLALPLATTQAGGVRIGVGIGVPYGGYYGGGYYGGPYYGGYYGRTTGIRTTIAPCTSPPRRSSSSRRPCMLNPRRRRFIRSRDRPQLITASLPRPPATRSLRPRRVTRSRTTRLRNRPHRCNKSAIEHRRFAKIPSRRAPSAWGQRRLQKLVVNPREFAFPSWQNCL